MDYIQARKYLEEVSSLGSVLGLDNMKNIMTELGGIQNELKIIHVAGTNGKGSTVSFINSILIDAGFKTGRYISPTIKSYRERFQINSSVIEKEEFAGIVELIASKAEKADIKPTVFEIETAIAFYWFYKNKCDFVILETGLGGSLDATNIIDKNICSVFTSISIDHTNYLGNTLSDIAKIKSGIIKEGSFVVSAWQEKEVLDIIKKEAEEKNAEGICFVDKEDIKNYSFDLSLQKFDYKEFKGLEISLLGRFQTENAALAIEVINYLIKLGYDISQGNIRKGILDTCWSGRFEIVRKNPLLIVDGAHNEDAALRLRESLQLYFGDRRLVFIMGVFADKDYNKIAELTCDLAEKIYTITPDNPRALDANELAKTISRYNKNVCSSNLEESIKECILNYKEDVVVVFGSLSFLGEAMKIAKAVGAC